MEKLMYLDREIQLYNSDQKLRNCLKLIQDKGINITVDCHTVNNHIREELTINLRDIKFVKLNKIEMQELLLEKKRMGLLTQDEINQLEVDLLIEELTNNTK